MSRASSGFESSHLPYPELHPSTSTTTGNSVHMPDLLCSSALGRPPLQNVNLQRGPGVNYAPSGVVSRSLSFSELKAHAIPQPLRRSLSLNIFCSDQKKTNIHLKNQSTGSPVQTEGSAQDSGNVHNDHQVASPSSSQPPATQPSALQDTLEATHSDTVERAPLQAEPDISGERSDLPPLTASILIPHKDAFPTETNPVRLTHRVMSANIEARRLKMKRDKKSSVNVGSLTEEKL